MSMIGKSLVHYEISVELGRGGMGEVYQAKDTKLGRDVAIKVLPEEFALDKDRVARFQREAKLLASLNHPNIAAIYGLEESEDTHFLVMELIEGQTLKERIKSGPIPVEEALKLALQMAEALEAAHENGVIHRDLKPANIKVTPDGKVKILDFGLAKAYVGDQDKISLADSPTMSAAATQQGVILGTAAYMSPEQAKGKTVDKRADIWAFGCVLYEMLTGQAAFQGEDVTDVLASVVKLEANLDLLPAKIHHRVRELLSRCLQKDMRRRYSGIGDARYEIDQTLTDPSGIFAQPISMEEPEPRLQRVLPWIATTLVLTAIVVGAFIWYLKPKPPPEPQRTIRFSFELPEDQQFPQSTIGHTLAVSPDGSQFVYCTTEGLYIRPVDEMDPRHIAGTDIESRNPFFSYDGKWLGYWSSEDQQLKKIAISGGAPVPLCDVEMVLGARWDADNTIVYAEGPGGIKRVSANGGTPESLVETDESSFYFTPQILPDGRSLLFAFTSSTEGTYKTVLQSLESGERRELLEGVFVAYLPTGHLLYGLLENAGMGNFFAVPFYLDTLEVKGGPVSVVENVHQMALPDSGTLVYVTETVAAYSSEHTLVWVDRQGNEEPCEEEPGAYFSPQISPDGTQVALSITVDGNEDIYNFDLIRGTKTRLTFDKAADLVPIWTPDGQRIIFCSERAGRQSIFWKASDGTGKVEQIASVPEGWMWPHSISDDGDTLFFGQVTIDQSSSAYNIGMLSMKDDDRTSKLLLQEEYNERSPQISPDGQWLAYRSDESGQYEIFVRPFPDVDTGGKWQVSTNGGVAPLWSPDGKELFYLSGDTVMAVSVDTDPTFRLGTPKSLFTGPYSRGDISPDGKRFLLRKSTQTTDNGSTQRGPRKINIVLNWFEELKQRVPVHVQ